MPTAPAWQTFEHPGGWRMILRVDGGTVRGLIAPSKRPGPGDIELDPVRFTSAVWPTITAAQSGDRPRWARHISLIEAMATLGDRDGHRWAEQAAHEAPAGYLRCSAQTPAPALRAIRGLA